MKQKLFYTAFSIIYDELKVALNLTQKEAVFNLIFSDLYQYAGVEIFDYDQFRKITSGINPIHSKVRKKLHTCNGFELFRSEIENNCLPYLKNILSELLEIFNQSENIPQEIKSQIYIEIADDYHISRTIVAILDCLDYSDYLVSKGKNCLFDKELAKSGYRVSRRKIGEIMKKYGLISKYTIKQFKVHKGGCNNADTPNIVDRKFLVFLQASIILHGPAYPIIRIR